ncbi:MAG: hypothetical protein A3K19_09315 [Lentisphaerae bacterium RIFOXYB12_FULL_65_16]|nr:MAG: hypothetical protein A3K18_24505 [Lentisphaerae bacterium RIFOXYA12_64_32]OGV90449.1 MAG: hypothetical protein A3K19_09315 [Lentisphaerae bacterium RIFOXYB12_FULL_65_16]
MPLLVWLSWLPRAVAEQGNGYTYDVSVKESAEDGDTASWDVYDNNPPGTITNEVDPDKASNRAIRLQGSSTSTGYRYTFPAAETVQFKFQWRQRYSEWYVVFVSCNTTAGHRYLHYTPDSTSNLGTGEYVHHGLGPATRNGAWTTLRRDLQKDIWASQPGTNITSVTAFLICGTGYVDDIRTYDYADADRDLVPDAVETANGLNVSDPSDGSGDLDGDGLTNAREIIFDTGIADSDSDDDGLSDGAEIDTYRTDPLNADTDGDSLSDSVEVACGMDPVTPATQGPGYLYDRRGLENAEDGDTAGWDLFDADPPGAPANAPDPDNPQNRVIQFQATYDTGFRFTVSPNETRRLKLEWRMRITGNYLIYASCNTSVGWVTVRYVPSTTVPNQGADPLIALGTGVANGRWVTVRRDLLADVRRLHPTANILGFYYFMVRAVGCMDDVSLLAYQDADRDCLPDSIETQAGLNPSDAADAAADADSDGLSNLDEFLRGTGMADADSDDDGLADGVEVNTHGSNPLSADTDADGLSDSAEVACGMDPLTPATQGLGYVYEKRVLEDAEDDDTVGWDLWDADPPGTLSNAVDTADPENRVIAFQGPYDTGYRLTLAPNETKKLILEWRMRAASNFLVYATMNTTAGWLNVRYVPATDMQNLGLDPIVALGTGLGNGQWVTVRRNLLADVRRLHPTADILYVYAFMTRGLTEVDDISLLAYPDADHDVLPDSVEIQAGLNSNDAADATADGDADGLSNLDEFMHGTGMADADSDDDGLNDGLEIHTYNSDPLVADTDGDGAPDGTEVSSGMDPSVAAIQGDGYLYEVTVHEDAEDGDTAGWDVYDSAPAGATVTNLVDPDDAANRAIQLDGSATANGYRLTFAHAEASKFKLQWRMRYAEPFVIFVSCSTTAGHRYVYYDSQSASNLGSGEYVHHGLGTGPRSGRWFTVRRDIQRDLWTAQPTVNITAITAFLICGSGWVDDVRTYAYEDTDRDLVPDAVETAAGLNPNDAADGVADLDSDSLSNADEVVWGTDLQAVDTDGDAAPDGTEVRLGLDPLDPADAAALIHDATEVADATPGLAVSYYKGEWRFIPSFAFFPHYGSGVVAELNMSESAGQVFASGRSDQVGAAFAGWIDVPADGWYIFHMTNNDGALLYIDGEKVAGTDGYVWHLGAPWQSQGDIGLRAGKHALRIEYFETYCNASLILEWEAIGLARQAVPAANLFHSAGYLQQEQAADDRDSDGLADADEAAAGTNADDQDSDDDGLSDGVEVHAHGTNPLATDTDSDGFSDGDEATAAFSDPVAVDFDGTVTDMVAIDGNRATVKVGAWGFLEREIFAKNRRGKLGFAFDLAHANCYRVEIEGTQHRADAAAGEFQLLLSVDGEYVGCGTLVASPGTYGKAHFYTPFLPAGAHSLDVEWDNVENGTSLQVRAVRLQRLGGPDADSNGRPDWADHRIAAMCGLDAVPSTSRVSPLCIEGTAHFLAGTTISDGTPVKRGTWRRWYADLPLSETGPTTATVSFQNGARAATVSATWVATNVLNDPDLTLRKGDALRLVALPEGATGGTVQIAVGADTFNTTPDAPVGYLFDAAGVFTVTGTYTPETGDPVAGELQVMVLDCAQPEPPAVWRFRERSWTWEGLPEAAVLDFDNILLAETDFAADSRTIRLLRNEVFEDVRVVARVSEGGPILATVPTAGFWLRGTVEGRVVLLQTYEDGSHLIMDRLFAQQLPASVRVVARVSAAGVVFDDGTLEKTLTAADFGDLGERTISFVQPGPDMIAVCHSVTVYQGDALVGNRD